MKKFLLSLVFLGLLITSTSYFIYSNQKDYIVLNKVITLNSINEFYNEILRLHDKLPIEQEIVIYFSSPGGVSAPTATLIERISDLKLKGRSFVGIIYGGCFSSCGSIFASMNTRFMTKNGIYMQHSSKLPGAAFPDRVDMLIDFTRLKPDAEMLGKDVSELINYFYDGDFVGSAEYMLKQGYIKAIVPQPDIGEI